MPKKLLIINAILLAMAGASLTYIVRQLLTPMPMPTAARARAAQPAPLAGEPVPASPPGAYASVAARNLFSPTRTETPPVATASASPAVKPGLFGIVLREGAPIAYLEDPTTKRVAGYRVGDAMAGGTVQTIGADNVVITRPDGNMDVRLRDPSRPRAAVAPPAAGVPGGQPVAAPPVLPGVIPPASTPGVPGQIVGPPVAQPVPGQPVQPAPASPPIIPGRRPLPPNLLRRLPQGVPADAQAQPQQ
jgi:hypothetical protein